jgi:hypothetical protein
MTAKRPGNAFVACSSASASNGSGCPAGIGGGMTIMRTAPNCSMDRTATLAAPKKSSGSRRPRLPCKWA